MSHSEQARESELPGSNSQPRSRLSSVYVSRTDKAHSGTEHIDHLDGLMLSCASHELPLDTLLGQVPCTKRAGLDRVRRLAQLGLLTIHRAADAATTRTSSAPEPAVASAPPPAHRVFRKPRPE